MSSLVLEYCGQEQTLAPGDELTFGRSGDLVIDNNPRLHRVLGRIYNENGFWWLRNEGRELSLNVSDEDSASRTLITAGRMAALTFSRCRVRFKAGTIQYEILLATSDGLGESALSSTREVTDDTIRIGDLPLTHEQRQLLVALAEPSLRDPHGTFVVLPNKVLAAQLGWTTSKFNRKLDNLCARFTRLGVSGLRGRSGDLASDRRRRLVEAVIAHGIVTPADVNVRETGGLESE